MTFVTRGTRYVKPSDLTVGQSFVGIYKKTYTDRFGKSAFVLKDEASGSDIVFNSSGSLTKQMELYNVGERLQITYDGMHKLTTGVFSGKDYHKFTVACDENYKPNQQVLDTLQQEVKEEEEFFSQPQPKRENVISPNAMVSAAPKPKRPAPFN